MKKYLIGLCSFLMVAASYGDDSFTFTGFGFVGTLFNLEDGYRLHSEDTLKKRFVGRLGNEPSNYWEVSLNKSFTQEDITGDWTITLASETYSDNDWVGTNDSLSSDGIVFREAYAKAKGLLPNKSINAWAGKRMYNTDRIYITSFWYRDYSGTGAGLEGLANGKFDIAYIARDGIGETPAPDNGVTMIHSLQGKYQVNDIVTVNATLLGLPNGDEVLGKENIATLGFNGDIALTIPGYYGHNDGNSFVVLQGGMGVGSNLGTVDGAGFYKDDSGVRLLTYGSKEFGKWTAFTQSWVQYDKRDINSGTGDKVSFSLAGRPAYKVTESFELLGEVGYGYSKVEGEDELNQFKVTFAPTLHLGKDAIFGRPQLRTFVSYNSMNQGDVNDDFISAGVQGEVKF